MKRFQCRLPYSGTMATLAAGTALLTLAGCSSLNSVFGGDKVNYSQAATAPSLQVPGDLAKPKVDQQYVAPPAAVRSPGPQMSVTQDGNQTLGLPNAQDPLGMHVAQDRDQHWLIVDGRSPQELWPILEKFWSDNGFELSTDTPSIGVMETNWAENRAKIPQDWFRKTFGKLVDGIYSSGTRDRFRTRVERAPDGSTAIFITHRGMEEVNVGYQGETTQWQDRPRDPNLELAFMGRMMETFGLTNAQAKQLITQAQPAVARVVSVDESSGVPLILVNDSLDRTWLRVGLALDRSDFVIDSSDRASAVFTVRQSDPARDSERHSGLFGKLFGGSKTDVTGKTAYQVNLRALPDGHTQISVLDANGRPDGSREARRLVSLLQAQLS